MTAQRPCPKHGDGQHRMTDHGREESLGANVDRCPCGAWRLADTDEWRDAFAVYNELRAERADEDRLTAAAGAAMSALLAAERIRTPST